MNIFPIILAAGQGTRMRSALPKVLHPIAGKPMLQHVVDACARLDASHMAVVYGHGGETVRERISGENLHWALQAEQKGTGHAVAQAIHLVAADDVVLVAYGDVPLIRSETLQALASGLQDAALCILTTTLAVPKGYGRIVRNTEGHVQAIVEEKDASDAQRLITEVNTGFIAARGADLQRWLQQLTPQNAQGEYYLTDCVSLAVTEGGKVNTVLCTDPLEVEGANNRVQLARLERACQLRQVEELMLAGVTVADPARLDIRGTVEAGQDSFIDINVLLLGKVKIGNNVVIEANCVIENADIGDNTHIKANCVIENAVIAANCDIGPFARLRPGTVLEEKAKIGNFVETKKAHIGKGSKVNHLSYIGDTEMGADVNIGAGTITCNYDGANKHKTVIGDKVFVGSCTQLVAPVEVGDGATIGAGSTITKSAPAGELTLSRAKQMTLKGWQRPVKEKK
ncbi:MAG: bifunctional UDP-N-acetylglucosamine diphosphorylase/glucosamine-1-phosphate N-acetyltransferase GlmU [Thiothrix sp.]|uniref:bifunctional UDP-N-acetylglucosamine diphosphorylase/glucosamine-1-phosphate N-acetyltransferase GlmU n=1 Tax=Thiothrix sp. TaxID=1032 RepID=UPI0026103D31|nr:bifunctional UDP-N-acetylglucosamine diphosphorylase/glucosamine-1-phosphate N-acetyltransferase GlmU [Thiothrix sp.]MDD5391460.1 bifunctional UDP-N-acetylglucosamine diphosphorylase/glucosamine-1-phosphate N-acetyltransferase GlmU [Thiothrix sp.]